MFLILPKCDRPIQFDDSDFVLISNFFWSVCRNGYAVTQSTWKTGRIYMHDLLAGLPKTDLDIDHRNRDALDNRTSNLRLITHQQNGMNRGLNKNNTTGAKGVSKSSRGNYFVARLDLGGKSGFLGHFKTLKEAADAYDAAALAAFGEFAYLNNLPEAK